MLPVYLFAVLEIESGSIVPFQHSPLNCIPNPLICVFYFQHYLLEHGLNNQLSLLVFKIVIKKSFDRGWGVCVCVCVCVWHKQCIHM
jgi:hypothetical protein